MQEAPGLPGDDLQRPLDESAPEAGVAIPGGKATPPETATPSGGTTPGGEAAPHAEAAPHEEAPRGEAAPRAEAATVHAPVPPPPRDPPEATLRAAVPAHDPAPPAGAPSEETGDDETGDEETRDTAAVGAQAVAPVGMTPARHVLPSIFMRAGRAAARAPGRAGRALVRWARRPVGRLVLPGLLMLALLGTAITGGALLVPAADGAGQAAPTPGGSAAPTGTAAPTAPPGVPPAGGPGASAQPGLPGNQAQGNPADALTDWAAELSPRTGVPELALRAYGYAELVANTTAPGCQLSWTTLAAIGRVESGHGSSGGAALVTDGRALPPIFGDPLDGQGDRAHIPDTDNGTLDNDPEYDRAIGPMQFIPTTWQSQAVDANGDGVADPHNVFDSALAAANYLCAGGRDLSTGSDWQEAVLDYNNVQPYADAVFAAANDYGQLSRG